MRTSRRARARAERRPARRATAGSQAARPGMRSGGEGGIRTHGALAHRFSRAAPSTTRTPLRAREYQSGDADRGRTGERGRRSRRERRDWLSPGRAPSAAASPLAAAARASSSSASSQRMPLTTLSLRAEPRVLGELENVPAAPSTRFEAAKTSASTSLARSAPTHIGQGSRVTKIVASASRSRPSFRPPRAGRG